MSTSASCCVDTVSAPPRSASSASRHSCSAFLSAVSRDGSAHRVVGKGKRKVLQECGRFFWRDAPQQRHCGPACSGRAALAANVRAVQKFRREHGG
jgi:hypothetical protein